MKKEKKTRFVILGMLLDKPHTGYEIGEAIKRSTNYFWQESDASIYPTLKLLASEGKIESRSEFVGRRRKEIFSITEKGKLDFYEWFQRPAEPDLARHEFLLKFFFATEKEDKILIQHLERRLRHLQQILDEYNHIEQKLGKLTNPRKSYWIKTLKNGIAHVKTDIAWVKEQLGEIKC